MTPYVVCPGCGKASVTPPHGTEACPLMVALNAATIAHLEADMEGPEPCAVEDCPTCREGGLDWAHGYACLTHRLFWHSTLSDGWQWVPLGLVAFPSQYRAVPDAMRAAGWKWKDGE